MANGKSFHSTDSGKAGEAQPAQRCDARLRRLRTVRGARRHRGRPVHVHDVRDCRLLSPVRSGLSSARVSVLRGMLVTLRPAIASDAGAMARIRETPEVRRRWRGGADMVAEVADDIADDIADDDGDTFAIEFDGAVVGAIQWHAETEPDYRHASMDIYLDPAVHGRGLGSDAVRTLARHLIDDHGHHRLVIDPAADNVAAIRCYAKVGFRAVGIMRCYERDADGRWRDGLLMDLLADELS